MNIRLTCLMLATLTLGGCGGSSDSKKSAIVGWAVGQGGIVHLVGQTLEVKKLADLPSGDFEVEKIDLTKTTVTDADLENLSVLPELQALSLHGTKISNEGMTHLTALKNLKDLDLSNTNITDEGLKILAGIPSLEKLHLHATAVSNKGLQEFHASVPGCQIFPAKK
jgi:Leucine-rich repeat (LRR) protein